MLVWSDARNYNFLVLKVTVTHHLLYSCCFCRQESIWKYLLVTFSEDTCARFNSCKFIASVLVLVQNLHWKNFVVGVVGFWRGNSCPLSLLYRFQVGKTGRTKKKTTIRRSKWKSKLGHKLPTNRRRLDDVKYQSLNERRQGRIVGQSFKSKHLKGQLWPRVGHVFPL